MIRMTILLSLVSTLVALVLGCDRSTGTSASTPPAPTSSYAGSFSTIYDGKTSQMTLTDSNGHITGTLDAATIDAHVDGASAAGQFDDPESGLKGTVTLSPDAQGIAIVISIGARVSPQIHFSRQAATAGVAQGHDQNPAPNPLPADHDPAVIGHWRYTWAKGEGGVSIAIDEWLYIEADGTMNEGPSKLAGEGVEIDKPKVGPSLQWRTENKIIYARLKDSDPWKRFAKYAVTPQNLMFTLNNGSKRVYDRQQ